MFVRKYLVVNLKMYVSIQLLSMLLRCGMLKIREFQSWMVGIQSKVKMFSLKVQKQNRVLAPLSLLAWQGNGARLR